MKPFEKFKPDMDNMLAILHEVQDANPNNYLTEADMKAVADYLNTTYSHIYGVATYYTMFSVVARGKYIIRLCNSPVCNMEGSISLVEKLKIILGIGIGDTTLDGLFTLEYTECLGRCGVAPGMMINRDLYGKLTPDMLESILNKYK